MKSTTTALLHLCLALPGVATATTFNRCEAASGEVTFTQLSCPAGEESSRQRAHNATPGGNTRTAMAVPEPAVRTRTASAQAATPERKARQPATAKPAKPEKQAKAKPKQKKKKYSPNRLE